MRAGDRVYTRDGAGTVAYVRMGPPDYSRPVAVSVVLDHCKGAPSYTGSIYLPSNVQPEHAPCECGAHDAEWRSVGADDTLRRYLCPSCHAAIV